MALTLTTGDWHTGCEGLQGARGSRIRLSIPRSRFLLLYSLPMTRYATTVPSSSAIYASCFIRALHVDVGTFAIALPSDLHRLE
jgi:hypothetical protein